jgi:uncharacterized Zn finger protein (UPF0148 family)
MSWDTFLGIVAEARQLARQDSTPVACGDDGEPLEPVDGRLHCPFCGRLYDR